MGQAAAAGGMSMAATGFTMLSEYTQSRAEAGAATYKSQLLEQEAQYGRLKADQTNAQMTRNLAITLGHVDAVRAAMHTDPTSPTGAAVRGEMEAQGTMRKGITVENILQQTRMDEANAAYMRSQASNALLSGDLAMLGTAFGAGAGAMKGMGGTPDDLSQPLPGSTPLGQGGIGSA
jgi:hypothetical protein